MMRRIVEQVMPAAYSVLPPDLRTKVAARVIVAIGAHASGYQTRRLAVSSSRRGFWLLGVEHVAEVLKFSKGRGPLVTAAGELGYRIRMMERLELQAALEHNDVLGFVVARCMLPPVVEAVGEAGDAWDVYRQIWEPNGAAADNTRWAEHYAAAGGVLASVGCS